MADPVMMKCGHAANATRDGEPACVICFGIKDGATEVAETPSLDGRLMRCTYDQPGKGGGGKYRKHEDGDSVRPTEMGAAFLELRPDGGWGEGKKRRTYDWDAWDKYDRFYCGCWGWD